MPFFFNGATRKPKIIYVAFIIFLVASAALLTFFAVETYLKTEQLFISQSPADMGHGKAEGHALCCTWCFMLSFYFS